MLPSDPKARKALPVFTGVIKYFPDALLAIAEVSKIGNDQHNPGQPLHWAKGKSTDHLDCMLRHAMEAGTVDTDGGLHSAKMAWRALAQLQTELEQKVSDKTIKVFENTCCHQSNCTCKKCSLYRDEIPF